MGLGGEFMWQLYALCYKNTVLFKRNVGGSLVLLLAPTVCVLIYGLVNVLVQLESVDTDPAPIFELARDVEGGSLGKCKVYDTSGGRFGFGRPIKNADCTTFIYSPQNAVIDEIMAKLAENNGLTMGKDVIGFDNATAMIEYVESETLPVFSGLLFRPSLIEDSENDFVTHDDTKTSGNYVLPYEIWYNNTVMFNNFLANSGDDGLRFNSLRESGYILKIQKAVGDAILAVHSGKPDAEVKFNVKPFPYVEGANRNVEGASQTATSDVEAFSGVFYITGIMIMFIISLRMITADKDNRILDALRMMGLYESIYWLSWFLFFATLTFFSSLLLVFAGKIVSIPMFLHTNFGFLWAVFYFYLLSMSSIAMFASVFMPNTKVAIMFGFLLLALGVLAQLIFSIPGLNLLGLMYNPYDLSVATRNAINLYPPLLYAKIDQNMNQLTKARTNQVSPGVYEQVIPGYLSQDVFDGPYQYYLASSAPTIDRSQPANAPCVNGSHPLFGLCYVHVEDCELGETCVTDSLSGQVTCTSKCKDVVCSKAWSETVSEIDCLAQDGAIFTTSALGTKCSCLYEIPNDFSSLMSLIGLSVFYAALAWYFGQILTFGHGKAEPFYFIFTKSYWFSKNPSNFEASSASGAHPSKRSETDDDVADEERLIIAGEKSGDEYPVILRNIVKDFGSKFIPGSRRFRAVDGVSLALRKGEVFALLGHNGAGKTTLINCMSGMVTLSGGDAEIYGKSVKHNMANIRHLVGVCPQHDILFDELSSAEHLRFYGHFQGMGKDEVEDQGQHLLKIVHLDSLKRSAGKFSGGMRRRLSMAIAALGNKRIVFLDEPTTGLDPQNQRHVWDMINEIKHDKVVVLTTHLLDEADVLGDRVGLMSAGRMIALGNPLHLKRKFGGNYKISVYIDQEVVSRKEIHDEVMRFIPKALVPPSCLDEASVGPIQFDVSENEFQEAPSLFEWIEKTKKEGKIMEWGLSQTSLEDVFNSTSEANQSNQHHVSIPIQQTEMNVVVPAQQQQQQQQQQLVEEELVEFEQDVEFTPTFRKQFRALFVKSTILQLRQRKTVCCQIVVPVILIVFMMLLQNLVDNLLGDFSFVEDPEFRDCALCMANQYVPFNRYEANSNDVTPFTIAQTFTSPANITAAHLEFESQLELLNNYFFDLKDLKRQLVVDGDRLFSVDNPFYEFCAYNPIVLGAPDGNNCIEYEQRTLLGSSFILEKARWISSFLDEVQVEDENVGFDQVVPETGFGFHGGEKIMVGFTNPGLESLIGESCFNGDGILEPELEENSFQCSAVGFGTFDENLAPRPFLGITGVGNALTAVPGLQCQFLNATTKTTMMTRFSQGKSGLLSYFPTRLVHSELNNSAGTMYSSPSLCKANSYDSFVAANGNGGDSTAINDISIRGQEGVKRLEGLFGAQFPRTKDGYFQARKLLQDYFPIAALLFDAFDQAQAKIAVTHQGYFSKDRTTCESFGLYPLAQVELQQRTQVEGTTEDDETPNCNRDNVFRPRGKGLGFFVNDLIDIQVTSPVNNIMNGITSMMLGGIGPSGSSPIGANAPHVTVGTRALPYKVSQANDDVLQIIKDAVSRFMGSLLIPLATTFLLPVFVFHLVHEKEMKLRVQSLMMGLTMNAYWFVQYIFDMTVALISLFGVYLIGMILNIGIISNHQFGIVLVLFFIGANVMVSMAFLFSTFINRTRNSNIIMYLFVLASVIASVLVNSLVFDETPFLHARGWWVWMPQMAFYRAEYLLALRSYYWEDLDTSDEMVQLWGIMILQSILMFALAIYLDMVIPKEFGMNRHPLFCCSRRKRNQVKVASLNKHDDNDDDDDYNFAQEDDDAETMDDDVRREKQLIMSKDPAVLDAPIRIENLKKQFGSFVAVDGVNLHMDDKQCFALLGPNGAGKSTTISILTGLYGPSAGDAFVNGKSILDSMHEIQQEIGVCTQHDIYYPDLTVREHLLFYARMRGAPSKAAENLIVNKALAAVQLVPHQGKRASYLSGGQRRRLTIASSLIGNPRTVFLDEPTTGLDPVTRNAIHKIILREKRKRCVVLTTHLMSECEFLSDYIGIMAHGKLKTLGTSQQLKSKFSEGFKIICVANQFEKARTFIETSIPGAQLETQVNSKMTFRVTGDVNIGKAFKILRDAAPKNGIDDFGLRMTSLEEVFVQLAKQSEAIYGTA